MDEVDGSLFDRGNGFPPELVGVVIQILFLEVAGHNFEGIFGSLVLSFDSGGAQLVVPDLLVLGPLDRKGSAGELLGIEPVFERDGAILA